MQLHPKQWKKIAEMVRTRTVVQVRTNAQKRWNENMSKSSIDINVKNLGIDDMPSNLARVAQEETRYMCSSQQASSVVVQT